MSGRATSCSALSPFRSVLLHCSSLLYLARHRPYLLDLGSTSCGWSPRAENHLRNISSSSVIGQMSPPAAASRRGSVPRLKSETREAWKVNTWSNRLREQQTAVDHENRVVVPSPCLLQRSPLMGRCGVRLDIDIRHEDANERPRASFDPLNESHVYVINRPRHPLLFHSYLSVEPRTGCETRETADGRERLC